MKKTKAEEKAEKSTKKVHKKATAPDTKTKAKAMKAMKTVGEGIKEGPAADKAEEEFDDYANSFDRYDNEDVDVSSLAERPHRRGKHGRGHGKKKQAKKAEKKEEADLDQDDKPVPLNAPKNVGGSPKADPDDFEDAQPEEEDKTAQKPNPTDKKPQGDSEKERRAQLKEMNDSFKNEFKAEKAAAKESNKKEAFVRPAEDDDEGEPEDCEKEAKPTLAAAQRETTSDKTGTAISEEFQTTAENEQTQKEVEQASAEAAR